MVEERRVVSMEVATAAKAAMTRMREHERGTERGRASS